MNSPVTNASLPLPQSSAKGRRTASMLRRWALASATMALAAISAWAGHAEAWTMATTAALLSGGWVFAMTSRKASATPEEDETDDTKRLVRQLVPVWKRNMDAARQYSERSANGLLESFSSISDHIDKVLQGHGESNQLEVSAIDALLNNHRPQLDVLLSTTREAVKLKDDMAQGVNDMAVLLAELVPLSKQVQAIGRATHLLAMNASVEAARAGNTSDGFGVVALEVQQLAVQSREAGMQISRHVATMQQRADTLKWHARRHDADDEEVALRAEENARTVLAQFISSVAQLTRSSRTLRSGSLTIRGELEKIFTGFQSQDRVSQMMCAITTDMQRMNDWLNGQPDPAANSARAWLDRLEASYTMEDQHTSHHATVAIDKATSVEFF